MGVKYEVSIWTKKGYARGEYHYQNVYSGNNVFAMLWSLWKNRKNGAVRVILR